MNRNTYTVQKGDTLEKIAKKYHTTVEKIIEKNQLENKFLSIGQVLLLPEEESVHIGSDICGPYQEEVMSTKYDTYVIQKGDNLYAIAKKFNTTVAHLIYMNHLDNQLLHEGQILYVPATSKRTISYTVKEGDKNFMGNNLA